MAAKCPKCEGKLRIIDWKPECPHCGVNMMYYGLEDRLLLDADKAEAEHARLQPILDRFKAAIFGSKAAIVRLVFSVLPLLAFLLPLGKFSFEAPFISANSSLTIIDIIKYFIYHFDLESLFVMFGSETLGTTCILFIAAFLCLLLSVVGMALHLIFVAFSTYPGAEKRNYTIGVINVILPIVAAVLFHIFSKNILELFPSVVTVSKVGWGIVVYVALLIATIVVDYLVFKKNIEVKYTPCFIGNIPADEYFKLVKDGVPLEKIREIMAERTAEKEAEEAAAAAAEEAAKAEAEAKEAETVNA